MKKRLLTLVLSALLLGCAGAVVESARMNQDRDTRNAYMAAALAGDAEAQYRVGRSFCCAPQDNADAFYNNRRATDFLCRAARQGHAAAAFEVGRIHSGERVSGIRLMRRAANLARGDALDNESLAYYWFSQARSGGHPEAGARLEALGERDSSTFGPPATAPCTLDEVYGAP